MQRRDVRGAIRPVPNDSASVRAVTGLVDPATASRTIVAIDTQGHVSTGARAIFLVVAHTGGVTGFLARVLATGPISLLFEPGYRLFARHRGRLARFFPDPE